MRAREFILEADEPVNRGRRGFLRAMGSGIVQSLLPGEFVKKLLAQGIEATSTNKWLLLIQAALANSKNLLNHIDSKYNVDVASSSRQQLQDITSAISRAEKKEFGRLIDFWNADKTKFESDMYLFKTVLGSSIVNIEHRKSVSNANSEYREYFYYKNNQIFWVKNNGLTGKQEEWGGNISSNDPIINELFKQIDMFTLMHAVYNDGSNELEEPDLIYKFLIDVSFFGLNKAAEAYDINFDEYNYEEKQYSDENIPLEYRNIPWDNTYHNHERVIDRIDTEVYIIVTDEKYNDSFSDKEIYDIVKNSCEKMFGRKLFKDEEEYLKTQAIKKMKAAAAWNNQKNNSISGTQSSGTQSSGIESSIEKFLEPIIRTKVYSQVIDKTISSVKANQVSQQTPQDNKPLALPDYTKITNDIISQAQATIGRELNDTEIEYIKSEVEKAKK